MGAMEVERRLLSGLVPGRQAGTVILPIGGCSSLTLKWILTRRKIWLPLIRRCCLTCRTELASLRLRTIWWMLATFPAALAQMTIQTARLSQSSTALGSHGLQTLRKRYLCECLRGRVQYTPRQV